MVLAGAQDFEDRIDPDVEREHTYADLLAEYESECAGVPCVITAAAFAARKHLEPVDTPWFLHHWRDLEFGHWHATHALLVACRDGYRTDCHWHNVHAPKVGR